MYVSHFFPRTLSLSRSNWSSHPFSDSDLLYIIMLMKVEKWIMISFSLLTLYFFSIPILIWHRECDLLINSISLHFLCAVRGRERERGRKRKKERERERKKESLINQARQTANIPPASHQRSLPPFYISPSQKNPFITILAFPSFLIRHLVSMLEWWMDEWFM